MFQKKTHNGIEENNYISYENVLWHSNNTAATPLPYYICLSLFVCRRKVYRHLISLQFLFLARFLAKEMSRMAQFSSVKRWQNYNAMKYSVIIVNHSTCRRKQTLVLPSLVVVSDSKLPFKGFTFACHYIDFVP